MKLLEDRIRKDGKMLPGDILKIDNFLNHQIDTRLMDQIGEEFCHLFKDANPNKILTIEASGIAIAMAAARYFDYIPVVFAKKKAAANMSQDTYSARERSYTRNVEFIVQVAKEYLNEDDRVLILDDFLANGETATGAIRLLRKAHATIAGVGVLVEKAFQPGREKLESQGIFVYAQAKIASMENDTIQLAE